MGVINRWAVIVKPREPFLQWMKEDDAEGLAGPVFEEMRVMPTVFLVAADDDGEFDPGELIRDAWRSVFEAMLESWLTDQKMWPAKRSQKMFEDWFEFEVADCVQDLMPFVPLESY